MNIAPLTLHIRLTKACNADCGYCSSWQESQSTRMSPEDFKRSIDFVFDEGFQRLGISPTHITAQYIGGEILTVPHADLLESVSYLRDKAAKYGIAFVDGVQSNLIGSPARAKRLYDLFEGRLGTSVDDMSDVRTVNGSAEKYRLIWREADTSLRRERSVPGAVYVLDQAGLSGVDRQMMLCARDQRMLTLRPLFQGGTPGQVLQGSEATRDAFVTGFKQWFMRLPIIVEPYFYLTQARLRTLSGSKQLAGAGCAFQADCTKRSLSVEPNGDLYVCQDMADGGIGKLGNSLNGQWDAGMVAMLSERPGRLDDSCRSCPYIAECQGGCMFEAAAQGRGMYGKSQHCTSWMTLFALIDAGVAEHGLQDVSGWLHRIETRHANTKSAGLDRAKTAAMWEAEF
ncbi:SPASM domain-containing protein [Pseudomonas sp. P66]|uniref:SPASM domain-containing protein n=1 Tax=Pseudomonas arcuscaelestis TaxID=2710591 RepID=A0ABS2BZD6_9PSED|nr:SPASM domain-containing protein [Pseudomonas arcuscaelestis]MBM5458984.1 SPASM domain-containing protein [Pseudomonas arcuscaelestis]